MLSELNINADKYPEYREMIISGQKLKCVALNAIPGTEANFNLATQELFLSIPLIAMRKEIRGIAAEDRWDDGITAFRMNYDINLSRKTSSTENVTDNEISGIFQPGLNLGRWRLRNISSFSRSNILPMSWYRGNTYATTSFSSIKSTLTVGDTFPLSDVFHPLPIRGIMLNTDEAMFPFYERSFSPAVKGIAKTHARVTVENNGVVIFNKDVPPGPFVLNELSLSAQNGELQVTIEEANGETIKFTVPWQTPTIAVPEGYFKYSFAAGEYRGSSNPDNKPHIYQATAIYGFNDKMTFYTGYQEANKYKALLNGGGVSLGNYGSASLDYTIARDKMYGSIYSGVWRLRYSINNDDYGTGLQFDTSRYVGSGTGSLADAIERSSSLEVPQTDSKYQYNLTLSQATGKSGTIYLNANQQKNFDGAKNYNFGGGYGLTLQSIGTLSLDMYQQNYIDAFSKKNKQRIISFALNIPLSKFMVHHMNTGYRWSSFQDKIQEDYSINGSSAEQSFFWNVSSSEERSKLSEKINTTSAQMSWSENFAQFGAWHTESTRWKASGTNISGGLLIHSEGVTTGQQFGETISLVNARGASGVNVYNGNNTHTDSRGYAIVSSIAPYQTTRISLDNTTLQNDVQISLTDVEVTPTRGAIVSANYKTSSGKQLLLTLKRNNGKPIPFGAIASLYEGTSTGIVDELGRVFMTGLPDSGKIKIQWSQDHCDAQYKVSKENDNAGLLIIDAICI